MWIWELQIPFFTLDESLCAHFFMCMCVFVCVCAVSEPTLKWKLKKLITTRPNPLQRKISAPPAVKHRTETLGKLFTFTWISVRVLFFGSVSCFLLKFLWSRLSNLPEALTIRFQHSLINFPLWRKQLILVGLIGFFPFCRADSSQSGSSNPASGCSSPNDSLHSDNGSLPLAHEVSPFIYI